MNGLGVRYLCSLSSRNRSGSNSSAAQHRYVSLFHGDIDLDKIRCIPSGPHKSVRRCMTITEYGTLRVANENELKVIEEGGRTVRPQGCTRVSPLDWEGREG